MLVVRNPSAIDLRDGVAAAVVHRRVAVQERVNGRDRLLRTVEDRCVTVTECVGHRVPVPVRIPAQGRAVPAPVDQRPEVIVRIVKIGEAGIQRIGDALDCCVRLVSVA